MSPGYGLRGSTILTSFILRRYGRVYTANMSDAWHIPRYPTQKHCITSIYPMPNKTANEKPDMPMLKLQYAMSSIPLYLPVIPCAQQLYWGPLEDFLKISSETFQLLRTFPKSSDHFRKFSDNFQTLPNIS